MKPDPLPFVRGASPRATHVFESGFMHNVALCASCRHGIGMHEDSGCHERGCRCAVSRRVALDDEVAACGWAQSRSRPANGDERSTEAATAGSALGARIRERRCRLGWSQSRLAAESGVERTTLQRIEAAKRRDPGFSIVVNLAAALGISLDAIASDCFSEVSIEDATQALSPAASARRRHHIRRRSWRPFAPHHAVGSAGRAAGWRTSVQRLLPQRT